MQRHIIPCLVRRSVLRPITNGQTCPIRLSRVRRSLPAHGAIYLRSDTYKIHPDMDVLFRGILEKDQTGTLVLPEGYTPELAELLKSRLEQNLGDAVEE